MTITTEYKNKTEAVQFGNIPEELKYIPNWTLWKYIPNGKEKPKKLGYSTKDRYDENKDEFTKIASSTDNANWLTFSEVKAAYERDEQADGIFFVLDDSHGVYGGDIDDTLQHELHDQLKDITYCEVSPSGNGLRYLIKGDKPKSHRNKSPIDKQLELYHDKRFISITGNRTSKDLMILNDESILDKIITDYFTAEERQIEIPEEMKDKIGKSHLSAVEIQKRIIKDKKRAEDYKFIFNGEWEKALDKNGKPFPSASEADMSLMGEVGFYASGDPAMMYEVYTSTNWYREEKDHKNGGIGKTIQTVIEGLTNVYDPDYYKGHLDYNIKFADDKPNTLKDLKDALINAGIEKRTEKADIDEKTGELKIKPLSPREAANILKEHCSFALLDYDEPDTNPLAVYNPAEGIYQRGTRFMYRLILYADETLSENQCKSVIHFLTIESDVLMLTQATHLKPLNNGIYDKKKERLLPFSKEYVFTGKVATDYVENAPEPTYKDWSFGKWINEEIAEGNADKIKLLWQIFSNAIDVNTSAKVLIFLYSDASDTAKSTFGDLLIDLVGKSNYTSLRIKDFEGEYNMADVFGKALVYGDDNYPKDNIDDNANLKSVASGDSVKGRVIYEKPFSFKATPLVVQSMNGLPNFESLDDGFLNRLRVLKFNKSYKGEAKNPRVKEEYVRDKKLHEYILFNALKYDSQNIIDTEESLKEKKHLQRTDPIYSFFEDVFSQLESERIPNKLLYRVFKAWHFKELDNETTIKQNTFTKDAKPYAEMYGYAYERKTMRPSGGDALMRDKKVYKEYMDIGAPYFLSLIDTRKQQPVFYKK